MNKNDKLIAAFLVSLGVFSSGVATQYVRALTPDQKVVLLQASNAGDQTVPVDNTNALPIPKRK
jgi:hypothetical protein